MRLRCLSYAIDGPMCDSLDDDLLENLLGMREMQHRQRFHLWLAEMQTAPPAHEKHERAHEPPAEAATVASEAAEPEAAAAPFETSAA